jgi:chromosome segregation protein
MLWLVPLTESIYALDRREWWLLYSSRSLTGEPTKSHSICAVAPAGLPGQRGVRTALGGESMKLKRIHISGFKSFADRLNLEFGEGITCIVGPNGCGKSNTSDAVRWVLGEQNPRALRANKMQDLIFSGTVMRKQEGMTEARLVFDNEDGKLPLAFAEIEVSRRLYRSGESEYFINKEPVRLKDVYDLFSNTGVGTHSYSLLEQGRVDGILKAKPSDRREIFEEAAGVTRFRIKQEEAQRKLKRVTQDLQRVDDIVGELARQVRSLKIQAGKAARYNEMHLELHRQELVRIHHQRALLDERIQRGKEELQRIRELKESLEEQVRKGALETGQAREVVELAREELVRFRGIRAELESEIRRHDDQLTHCRAMESELQRQGERTRELEKTLSTEREEAEGSIEAKLEVEERLRQELVEFEVEENLLASQEQEGQGDFEQARSTAEQARKQLAGTERSIETLSKEIEHVSQELASIEERRGRQEAQSHEAEEELRSIDNKVSAVAAIHQDTKADHEREESLKLELTQTLQGIEKELNLLRTENERLRTERSRLSHRLESLKELQAQHEGQGEGIKQAFQKKRKGEAAFQQIQGQLIEKVRPQPGYEDVLEVALSNWLQSVILDNHKESVQILEALRSTPGGRITCVSKDLSGTPTPDSFPEIEWNTIEGAVLASDVVSVDPEFETLIVPLLRRTVILPDLPQLETILPRLREGWMAVTRQGEVAGYPSFVSGGRAVLTGFLRRQGEIEEIERKLAALNQEWQASEDSLQRTREARRETAEELRAREEAIRELVVRMAAKHEELQGLTRLRQKVEKTLESSRQDLERLQGLHSGLVQKKVQAEESRSALETNVQSEREAAETTEAELRRIEQALRDLQAKHHRHRETFIALKKDLERCQAEINQARQRRGNLENRITELKREEQERESKIWEVLDKKGQAEEALKGLFERVDKVEQDISEQDANLVQMEERYRAVEEQVSQIREMLNQRNDESQKWEMENHRVTLEQENLQRRLVEELQSDWETCTQVTHECPEAPSNLEDLAASITSLRERIGKMGEINPLAVQEFAEQKERLDFLTQQQEDLVKAKVSLERTISEVKKSARKQFIETFELIRQNFNRTFRRILGGGRADLLLLNEMDVFESGVEIVAQPPGKKMQSITLMSGGEKSMTAIALLFAIYQVKASPFCFLDEVDAALDDANVDRFARLLLDYSHQTQFIIVTHNKHTMAVADRLYGVTMHKPGISTVVSMEFEHRADYNLTPLPEVDDDPLPVRDYDAALSEPLVEDPDLSATLPEGEEVATDAELVVQDLLEQV